VGVRGDEGLRGGQIKSGLRRLSTVRILTWSLIGPRDVPMVALPAYRD
jgi:hypothetical protein